MEPVAPKENAGADAALDAETVGCSATACLDSADAEVQTAKVGDTADAEVLDTADAEDMQAAKVGRSAEAID